MLLHLQAVAKAKERLFSSYYVEIEAYVKVHMRLSIVRLGAKIDPIKD